MIWHKVEDAWKAYECMWMEILGTTGLAPGWSEWTSTSGPSGPLASLTPPLNKTAAWDLTVKMAFYRPARLRGVLQTSTTLVSCESTNNKLSKTIQGTMLHKTVRLRAWQEYGSCDDLTLRVKHLDKGGHEFSMTHQWVWLPKWSYKEVAIKYGERQSKTMWR